MEIKDGKFVLTKEEVLALHLFRTGEDTELGEKVFNAMFDYLYDSLERARTKYVTECICNVFKPKEDADGNFETRK